MDIGTISKNTEMLLKEIPDGVTVVAAAKGRSYEEIKAAVAGGIRIIGHNYVKEAEAHLPLLKDVDIHMIGHLQTNKAKKAIKIFKMIQTLDSLKLAQELQRLAEKEGILVNALVEVNSAKEPQKTGLFPEEVEVFLKEIVKLRNIYVRGLMTMGPVFEDPEAIRPYFRSTRRLFEELKGLSLPNVTMEILSMGMSDSYRVAIEEGANMVRIGTKIFGPR